MGLELVPPSLPPIRTSGAGENPVESEDHVPATNPGAGDHERAESVTPKLLEQPATPERARPPPPLLCPPAPRKPRPAKRKFAPPPPGFYPVPSDLAAVFVPRTVTASKKIRVG